MTTYVGDCDLDAAKPLRTLVWKVVRTQFAAKDPVHMQKILGVVREALDSTSSCRGLRLTQGDYTAKILEDAVKLGFGPNRVCTTAGQSVTPPDPKLLPEQPCDPGVRELSGSLLLLSRCTRFDIYLVIARLARFVTRWCEWARKEIRHFLGFVAHTAAWSLIMKSADDDWAQHFLRCIVRHEMFRRILSQADGVKRQLLLDRVGKSSTRSSEHEFDRARVD